MPPLEVHLLGGSKGESIVLGLPDGQWGVVDCYSGSVNDGSRNPTTQFLRSRGITSLLFVCLTHAHDDHYMGMVKLLEEFNPREFWRFGCLAPEHIAKLMKYNLLQARKAVGAKREELSRSAKELQDLFLYIRDRARSKKIRFLPLVSRSTAYPLPKDLPGAFRIECVSPSGPSIARYERAIVNCVGPDGKIVKKLPHSQHNYVSVVLLITYGKSKIILGGDLEKVGWLEVVEEYGEANLSVDAVKVSHHGSKTGYCEGLWDLFSRGKKPVAFVAPLHGHKLPKPEALDHISERSETVVATCKPELDWSIPKKPGQSSPDIESRMAIRDELSAMRLADGGPCGQCSLVFDNSGNCQIELTEPALSLTKRR